MATQSMICILIFLIKSTFMFLLASTKPSHYLLKGSSISVEDTATILISLDKTFSCGFYTLNNSLNAYYFSIWFTNSREKTIVWTANRDSPVNGLGSMLSLRQDGVLALTDFDGSNVWETNTSSTMIDRAELLDSGNLVIKDTIGNILWQSFDFPTDTLLANQHFGKNNVLISRIGPLDFSEGFYRFLFDNDNVLKLMYDGPEISSLYWPELKNRTALFVAGRINYNISREAKFDDMGTFISSDKLQFSASDIGFGVKGRLVMDYDGNLRLYSLDDTSRLWSITWQAIAKQCDVHGRCGRNAICIYTPKPQCSCPPYFEPYSSSDLTMGCKPRFERSCLDTDFVEISHANYDGYDLEYEENVTLKHCRKLCLKDCDCQGFKYKRTMKCWTRGALFNGYRDSKTSFYIRIPRGLQTLKPKVMLNVSKLECENGYGRRVLPKMYNIASKQTFKWTYVFSFAGAIGAFEVILFVGSWYFLYRKHWMSASLEKGYQTISSQFRSFSYSELERATAKFKDVLGRGGFGAVYKGVLTDTRVVAVKKLENVVRGEEEFWAEVSTFGRVNHMNLTRMWGFCSERKHRLLVYEYVENGSLENHLFSSSNNIILEWQKRFKIALGTAKGLAYLHHECLEWVIHCDVKPENILLDCEFEPKISDFGLVKLCQRGGDHGLYNLSQIRGTKGYMAPEWTTNLPLTAKVDVYSYGVVVLELVSGNRLSRCVVNENVGEDQLLELRSFARLAKQNMEDVGNESWMMGLVDPRLEGNFDKIQAAKMIEIGLLCIEDDRNKRPTMESVAHVLAECE